MAESVNTCFRWFFHRGLSRQEGRGESGWRRGVGMRSFEGMKPGCAGLQRPGVAQGKWRCLCKTSETMAPVSNLRVPLSSLRASLSNLRDSLSSFAQVTTNRGASLSRLILSRTSEMAPLSRLRAPATSEMASTTNLQAPFSSQMTGTASRMTRASSGEGSRSGLRRRE